MNFAFCVPKNAFVSLLILTRNGFISTPITLLTNSEVYKDTNPQLLPISSTFLFLENKLPILYSSNLFSVDLEPTIPILANPW